MSADNYYRICRHPKGGYAAVMGFMSNKLDGYEAEPRDTDPQFDTVQAAIAVAERETILEYGIEIDSDCLPQNSLRDKLQELAIKWYNIAGNEAVAKGTQYGYRECANQLEDLLAELT